MSILTTDQKNTLYSQIKSMGASITAPMLRETISQYDNLTLEELRPHISGDLYNKTLQLLCDPQSIDDWSSIEALKSTAGDNINIWREIVSKLNAYIAAYKDDRYSKISDANTLLPIARDKVATLEARVAQKAEWDMVDKSNYEALKSYVDTHPTSPFVADAFDDMWRIVSYNNDIAVLQHFAALMERTLGGDVYNNAIYNNVQSKIRVLRGPADEWSRVDKTNIVDVHKFCVRHRDFAESRNTLDKMKQQEIEVMRQRREEYSRDTLKILLDEGVFTDSELLIPDLATTPESLRMVREPKMIDEETIDMNKMSCNIAGSGCTDVYFFGVPGTGKTCLLMGLVGASGSSIGENYAYAVNQAGTGGQYAMLLDTYVSVGQVPEPTRGNFTTAINMTITDTKRQIHWPVNLIDMAGEAFLHNMAINPNNANLADMGLGVDELLRNSNKKIFFFIVDPTKRLLYDEQTGSWVLQKSVVKRFIDLIQSPENADIMRNVLAVHFIVTKADRLAQDSDGRKTNAAQILRENFGDSVLSLNNYCNRVRTINQQDGYGVKCFPFSIGEFYLAQVFDFRTNPTLDLVRVIQQYAIQQRSMNLGDILSSVFN